ncbi:protein sprint isoform X15 [Dermacentor silvarum]|uniref:protein sprint isoform X4 n=1 Tax=Dermacentor silvarum TaxID=543639 RepID=UPI0021008B29|nr:protein sprint isoform X4 [Dermacentor silvarum]XP_049526202.1 protein sprint isoform X5 [Dermacentor silvarum]XP_049526203.1 protein sprint isoform X6 [Dermacentor silvarum]XP_049526204.1 protein sprint isoform X7 [Dermacentor silvarum]XP_049526205.1 protein sprint isoform X8 [Dermacentor silvarum]XP_049526206.1 protein sprint isoform X9 [Dermacentor silvarum]XP_049526207.1 protein sprint isoform X10 [Dermacentor silvarum]XP_049526208.1 protein sprint isoform X11 [Dermacentor silvarum]X
MLQGQRSDTVSSVCTSHHGLPHDTSVHRVSGGFGPPVRRATREPGRTEGRETPPPPIPPRAPVVRIGSTYASHCAAPLSSFSKPPPLPPQGSSASSADDVHCSMTLLERLIRTSSIWFLPDVGRTGAVHYLQGKEVGNFIVRQSSKKGTLALSVRLPVDAGPYIEHYLIEATTDAKHCLEGSENHFASIPVLICHYCQCCDELPVQLCLPVVLLEATTRQELSALSLLGQELWVSSLLKSAPSSVGSSTSCASSQASPNPDHNANVHVSSFKKTTPANPVVTSPVAAVRPNFLALQSSTADIGELATQVPDPPSPPAESEAGLVSEVAGRSAFYVGVDLTQSEPSKTAPSKTAPSKTSPSKTAPSKTAPSKTAPSKTAPSKTAPSKTAPSKIAPSKAAPSQAEPCKSAPLKSAPNKNKQSPPAEEEKPRCLMKPSPRRRRKLPESSPETYYSSSLADKISDYEDIWGTTNGRGSDSPAPVLSTFKPEGLVCQSTQTEVHGGSLPEGIDVAGQIRSLSRSMPGMVKDKAQQGQFSSPFYSEPVDSLFLVVSSAVEPLQIDEVSPSAAVHRERPLMRHSEPNVHSLRSSTQRSSDLTTTFDDTNSCTSDHLLAVSAPALHDNSGDGPPSRCGRSWSVDPSWKWLVSSEDEDNDSTAGDLKFPTEDVDDSDVGGLEENVSTVEEIIGISMPDLRVPPAPTLTEGNVLRASRYDNLDAVSVAESVATDGSSKNNHGEDDALTEFCEPWDSLRWERLLRLVESSPDAPESKAEESKMSTDSFETASAVSGEDLLLSECPTLALEHKRSSGFQEHLDMLLASRKLGGLYKRDSTVGADVKSYIFKLVQERNTTFAMTIENFIQCTRESSETSPAVVMRNIRQFMSGMKNYLLKHGEGQFEQLVQEEQSKLKPDEFMNIDAIIEVSLHRLVIKPLRRYLYQLFVKQYTQSGALKLLSDSMKYARTKTPQELGIKSDFEPPRGVTLELVQHFLVKLQKAYSPLRKLENLLSAISVIYSSVQRDRKSQPEGESFSLGADDFLPIFLHVLVQCGLVSAEVEADYMWGLLHPSLLTGEGGYYLTTLSSAVHVLKSLRDSEDQPGAADAVTTPPQSTEGSSCKEASAQPPLFRYPRMADLQGFMQIVIPDELSGSIVAKTLPVLPHMTAKEVRKMIAHKFRVTNPEDYGLFKLVKGEETQLTDNDCPQAIKADLLTSGVECRFAYKRYDVKFVWPFSDKSA